MIHHTRFSFREPANREVGWGKARSNRHGSVERTWQLIILNLSRCSLQGRIIKSMGALGYQKYFQGQILGDEE